MGGPKKPLGRAYNKACCLTHPKDGLDRTLGFGFSANPGSYI